MNQTKAVCATLVPVLLAGLTALGCAPSGAGKDAGGCDGGDEQGAVMTRFTFARQMPPGVSPGFDIDHHVALMGDPMTCGHPSLTSPDGVPGVDNALSTLLPALDAQTHGAIDGIIQGGINNGMLLIGVDLTHVTGGINSPCVDIAFEHVSGTPTVGTDQILDANQTFNLATDVPVSHVAGAITEHVLEAGPFDLAMPVRLLDAKFTLNVHQSHIRATLADDGSMVGVIGGGVLVDDIIAAFADLNIGVALKAVLPDLLVNSADLAKDANTGNCTQMSVALTFEARNAFFNP